MDVHQAYPIEVIKVEPYTADCDCAAVTLRSPQGDICVFSYPCDVRVGSRVHAPLSSLDAQVQAAFLDDWPQAQKNACAVARPMPDPAPVIMMLFMPSPHSLPCPEMPD